MDQQPHNLHTTIANKARHVARDERAKEKKRVAWATPGARHRHKWQWVKKEGYYMCPRCTKTKQPKI